VIKFIKKIVMVAGFFLILFIILGLIEYLKCPIYQFPDPIPFQGNRWYNPYSELDSTWFKGNFQVQSHSWGGLTNGWDDARSIYQHYKNLGYDIIAISDYQKINRFDKLGINYIPVYEHGFNIGKRHQVLIGANEVNWNEFIFWQNIHQKQHILKKLRTRNPFVVIAHPRLLDAYNHRDLFYLTDYDAIEVLNHFRISEKLWDAALSAGKPVWIIGNDDSHDITNPAETGVCWTMIQSKSTRTDDVVDALKKGKMYGVTGNGGFNDIHLSQLQIKNSELMIACDQPARKIRFIGQGGVTRYVVENVSQAKLTLAIDDTYIRIEVESERCKLFLNPVFRYEAEPLTRAAAMVEPVQTNLFRFGFAFLFGTSILIARRVPLMRRHKIWQFQRIEFITWFKKLITNYESN